jgi:hypothetical protein
MESDSKKHIDWLNVWIGVLIVVLGAIAVALLKMTVGLFLPTSSEKIIIIATVVIWVLLAGFGLWAFSKIKDGSRYRLESISAAVRYMASAKGSKTYHYKSKYVDGGEQRFEQVTLYKLKDRDEVAGWLIDARNESNKYMFQGIFKYSHISAIYEAAAGETLAAETGAFVLHYKDRRTLDGFYLTTDGSGKNLVRAKYTWTSVPTKKQQASGD